MKLEIISDKNRGAFLEAKMHIEVTLGLMDIVITVGNHEVARFPMSLDDRAVMRQALDLCAGKDYER